MKKWLWIGGLLGSIIALPFSVWAANYAVWLASNTATADTTLELCPSRRHATFHGACVNTGSAGTLSIYDADGTATTRIAAINTANQGCLTYDVRTSSGITYTNSATANVTMLFTCY